VKKASKVMTAALVLLATIAVAAQDSQPAALQNKPAPPVPVSLKVSLVFSRYQGEKKVTSVAHTFWVTTGDRTSLRLGTQIPVPTTVMKEGTGVGAGGTGAVQSYNYRDVGTNIDCSANALPDGAYRLNITITDSSVYYPDQSDSAVRSSVSATGAPAFRNFNSTFTIVLKDGQTGQSTSVTDPVSGQVIKLDATLNVQK
jgi:Bacterial type II and III secretion system protein